MGGAVSLERFPGEMSDDRRRGIRKLSEHASLGGIPWYVDALEIFFFFFF